MNNLKIMEPKRILLLEKDILSLEKTEKIMSILEIDNIVFVENGTERYNEFINTLSSKQKVFTLNELKNEN